MSSSVTTAASVVGCLSSLLGYCPLPCGNERYPYLVKQMTPLIALCVTGRTVGTVVTAV